MSDVVPFLTDLGWQPHLAAQLDPNTSPDLLARVMAVHRDAVVVLGPGVDGRIQRGADDLAVGDWVVLDPIRGRAARLLERRGLFQRRTPGGDRRIQLIAANVDSVFLVTSANQEFNPARLERYLAIAAEADVAPVVVITKVDLAEDAAGYLERARAIRPGLMVLGADARRAEGLAGLAPWLGRGQTVALLGSSGVGKSTLVNSIAATELATADVRAADDRGRHTTTGRSLHRLAGGAWLVDTPGMRELQLVDAAQGIAEVFDDVSALAEECRFADCGHQAEPGCAVRAAIDAGTLAPDRLARYRKLVREERHNSESVAEARARERGFGRMAREVMSDKARRRGDR